MTDVMIVGGGWVGGEIARSAAAVGTVTVLDLPTEPWLAERDATATENLRAAIASSGVTALINAVGRLRGTDDEMVAANVSFVEWLMAATSGLGLRVVHIGSAGEYGDPGSPEPVPETATPNPVGIYGTTKWAGTQIALAAREAGNDVVVGRGFNLLGPHMPPGSPVHQFLTDIDALGPAGGEVEVWEPRTFRDFIGLDDLAAAMVRLATVADAPDLVNVCSGVGLYYGELAVALGAARGKQITISSRDAGGIMAVVGDNSRLVDVCGIVPQMSLDIAASLASL